MSWRKSLLAMQMENDSCWNYSRKGGRGGIKENDTGGEFKYDILDILQELL
jgi:hypothetical protein